MTTRRDGTLSEFWKVVEAYRLDRYDNLIIKINIPHIKMVVEAYRLDRYDNFFDF